jgi:hypothetical protein
LRHELEAEGEGRGDHLAEVAYLEVDLRDPASVGVAGGDSHDVAGYGELVHGLGVLLPGDVIRARSTW